MVILIGTLLGVGCGCAFGVIISRIIINKRMMELEEAEKFRILEKQLSVVAEKCDRTHKACCLLSDIVKENYKTEEKEERETSKIPWSEIDKINARNMGHQIIRYETEKMMNSVSPVLFPQTCSILSQQECSVEDLTLRNMALMQNCCSVSAEEAQRRIFHAMFPGWRLPDDPD